MHDTAFSPTNEAGSRHGEGAELARQGELISRQRAGAGEADQHADYRHKPHAACTLPSNTTDAV